MHFDSGSLLAKAASRRDGYILTTGLVARPGIYLYEIDGRMVRELVTREVLQDPEHVFSYAGKPLTIVHNPSESGPHYTIDELGAGVLSGATGIAMWNEEEDAQEVQVNIWTVDGRDAYEDGAQFLSPAYPAQVIFFKEPQFDDEFGWHDAVQVHRGEINHTTQTDDPRGGPRMAIKGDSRGVAQRINRADGNHANTQYPNYGGMQSQPPQAQHIHYHGDMAGGASPGGAPASGGGSMEQAVHALLESNKQTNEKLDRLLEALAGGKQQSSGDGQGANSQQIENGDAAQVAYFNERERLRDVADAMSVSYEEKWGNSKLKRAIVASRHKRLGADTSDALVHELYKTLELEAEDLASQPDEDVRARHLRQGDALSRGRGRKKSTRASEKSKPISFGELNTD